MKKVYSSLIMLFVTLAAFAQTLTADRVEVPQGRTAELTFNITGAQQFIASGMYINLPQGFTFVYDDEEEAYCIPGTVFTKSHSIAERLQTATTLKLAISSMKNSAFKNNSGSLISVTIACGAGVKAGTYTSTLHGIEFSNLNNELVKIDDVAFTIVVPGSTDPEPTPTDTTTVTPTPVTPTPTDTTTVTPTPVTPTPTDTTTVTPTPTPGAVKSISAQNISVEAGSRATGIINITGATEYIAAGMYINIPQGFSFVYNDDEESYAVPGSVFSKSHSVTDRLQSSSVLKFAVVSSGNAKFKTAEGSLVSFDIACGANVAPGTYKASLNTIELSTVDNKLYKQDKVEFTITVLAKTNPQPVEPTPGDTTDVTPIPVTPEVASLSVTDVSVQAADRATAVVSVENAAQYIAAGMLISLPEGFMFEYNDSEESFCLPGDVLAKSHSIADNLQKTNVLKIAISSLKNANFGKDSGSLFSFTVKAAASVAAGTYTGTIKRTEFATEDNSLVTIPDETFTITVSPGSEPEPVEPVTTNNVSIDNISIEAGAQATATIKLKDASQYMAAGMFITLPDGFSFVYSDDAEGYCTQGNIFAKTHSISDNLQNASVLKFVVASIKNAAFVDMANPTLLSFS